VNSSVLIVDDEPLAIRSLRGHLIQLGWGAQIHEAGDGRTAISIANERRPSLLFLDIVMPGPNGLQVLNHLDYEPKVIFTTAHVQYAITAFELGAVDYLLKPFGQERLSRVLNRVESELLFSAVPLANRVQEAMDRRPNLSRIFVRDGHRIVPINLFDLERAQGADDYVSLFTLSKEYLVNVRLSTLEGKLSAAHFARIHRSHLINLDFITAIEPHDASRMRVVMKSGLTIVASRAGSRRLRRLAD
jgi:two-component system LytT family response regulator